MTPGRMALLTLVASALACGGGGDGGDGEAAGTNVVGEYSGTLTTRYQRIDNLAPGGFSTVTHDVLVSVKTPLEVEDGGKEENPFSLRISIVPERTDVPGAIHLQSANVAKRVDPDTGLEEQFVSQDWTYTLSGGDFDGTLSTSLDPVFFSWVTTEESGGIFPVCLGYMHRGATISGKFDGNQITLSLGGEAGATGTSGGGTCALGAVFQFEAEITATRP